MEQKRYRYDKLRHVQQQKIKGKKSAQLKDCRKDDHEKTPVDKSSVETFDIIGDFDYKKNDLVSQKKN